MSAGKGDRPRNCFSRQFRDNYEAIDWEREPRGAWARKLIKAIVKKQMKEMKP